MVRLNINGAASMEDNMPGLFDERRNLGTRADRSEAGEGNGGGSFPRFWKNLLIIFAIAQIAFIAGMNWHRVDALQDEFHLHVQINQQEHAAFARQDVVTVQQLSTDRRLEEVKQLLERLLERQGIRR